MNDEALDPNSLPTRVRQVMSVVFGIDRSDIGPESSPATIPGWDSVNHIQLMLALEDEFGVQFRADDFASVRSVIQIESLVKEGGGE